MNGVSLALGSVALLGAAGLAASERGSRAETHAVRYVDGRLVVPQGHGVRLSLGAQKSRPERVARLASLVPARATHVFALHPENWAWTFYSLTNKEPKKVTRYAPTALKLAPGTLVAEMKLATRYLWSGMEEDAVAYAESVRALGDVDISSYEQPELLVPRVGSRAETPASLDAHAALLARGIARRVAEIEILQARTHWGPGYARELAEKRSALAYHQREMEKVRAERAEWGALPQGWPNRSGTPNSLVQAQDPVAAWIPPGYAVTVQRVPGGLNVRATSKTPLASGIVHVRSVRGTHPACPEARSAIEAHPGDTPWYVAVFTEERAVPGLDVDLLLAAAEAVSSSRGGGSLFIRQACATNTLPKSCSTWNAFVRHPEVREGTRVTARVGTSGSRAVVKGDAVPEPAVKAALAVLGLEVGDYHRDHVFVKHATGTFQVKLEGWGQDCVPGQGRKAAEREAAKLARQWGKQWFATGWFPVDDRDVWAITWAAQGPLSAVPSYLTEDEILDLAGGSGNRKAAKRKRKRCRKGDSLATLARDSTATTSMEGALLDLALGEARDSTAVTRKSWGKLRAGKYREAVATSVAHVPNAVFHLKTLERASRILSGKRGTKQRRGSAWRSVRDVESDIEDIATIPALAAAMVEADARRVVRHRTPLDLWVHAKDDYVVSWDDGPVVSRVSDFIQEADLDTWFPGVEQAFSDEFWKHPSPLYHATTRENASAIVKSQLGPRQQTRGLSNRGTGAAVFTTVDEDKATDGTYGDAVFRVDTRAMKAAGVTPFVSEEAPWREAELRRALAHLLDVEYEEDVESCIDPDTIIVHGAIPARFLTRVDA